MTRVRLTIDGGAVVAVTYGGRQLQPAGDGTWLLVVRDG